jgi:serine/threonine protein phosphatase PrpC
LRNLPGGSVVAPDFQQGPDWSAATAKGLNRSRNCDAFALAVEADTAVLAIGDGVGSLPDSALASRAAVDSAVEALRRGDEMCLADVWPAISRAVAAALPDGPESGATTLTVVKYCNRRLEIASIGDSEALIVPAYGAAIRLNQLHNPPGRPNELLAWLDGCSRFRPDRVLWRLRPGETICLVTDGISRALDYSRIAGIIRESTAAESARLLVDAAQAAGAGDDLTAIVYRP